MSELTILRDVVTIVGVIVGFTYYVINVRNAQRIQQLQLETRQYQLYNAIAQNSQNKANQLAYFDVMYKQVWADFEEFWQKYGPHTNPDAYANFILVGEIYNVIGILVEKGAVDPALFYRHNGPIVLRLWEKIEPLVKGTRNRENRLSSFWIAFENLYQNYLTLEQRESTSTS